MNIQTAFTFFILLTFNFTNAFCNIYPLNKSDLPEIMPDNVSMSFSENGGMAPTWYKIEISNNQLVIENKEFNDEEPTISYTEVSKEEINTLYQVFVKNKFDTIKNDEREEIVYDAGSEGIYLSAGKISKNVSYGMNSPLSGSNLKRYQNVVSAIKSFALKHKKNAKSVADNSVVIDYDPSKHKYIFESGGFVKLNNLELDELENYIEKAVDKYNQNNGEKINDLSKYKRQFIIVTDKNKDRIVWANLFCSEFKSWKKSVVVVDDGGNCYFNLYINLTQRSFEPLNVNGNA